jgi:hypothetical protein
MADTGKAKDTKPVYDAELPADEEFEEEPEESTETEAPAKSASSGLRGMFGMGRRGTDKAPAGKPKAKVVAAEPGEGDEAEAEDEASEDQAAADEAEGDAAEAAGKDEAPAGDAEAGEGEAESDEAALAAVAASDKSGRFNLGRGRKAEEETEKHRGSVREAHDRVHIDDRPSAVYALICAVALIGVLALTWLGGAIPKGAGPTLTPLSVPTTQPSASTSAAASVSVAASVSAAPSATPTPTLAPTPTPSAAASK